MKSPKKMLNGFSRKALNDKLGVSTDVGIHAEKAKLRNFNSIGASLEFRHLQSVLYEKLYQ